MKCSMTSICLTSNLQLILKWVLSAVNWNLVSSKMIHKCQNFGELESVFFEIDMIVRKLKLYKWFQKTLWYNILYRNENIRFKKETNINAREIDIIFMKIFSSDLICRVIRFKRWNEANDYSDLQIANIVPIKFLRNDIIIYSEVLSVICFDSVIMISGEYTFRILIPTRWIRIFSIHVSRKSIDLASIQR